MNKITFEYEGYYHVRWKTDWREKKYHHSKKQFKTFEEAEKFLKTKNAEESNIQLRLRRI